MPRRRIESIRQLKLKRSRTGHLGMHGMKKIRSTISNMCIEINAIQADSPHKNTLINLKKRLQELFTKFKEIQPTNGELQTIRKIWQEFVQIRAQLPFQRKKGSQQPREKKLPKQKPHAPVKEKTPEEKLVDEALTAINEAFKAIGENPSALRRKWEIANEKLKALGIRKKAQTMSKQDIEKIKGKFQNN
ncbi:MAG: hypothetical protein Q7K42_04340 [Candidatus Diapherotrites archaeon]|nr:hypothetical protein [Candidatus Diapherotrites archaeon]